ncbi:MAG: zinc ABC transporter substrate-binding protein [Oleiphilaceae bacterium]|nr:zinc ABC transporter substrate-binding protein [Oleiphilaceae bacterium]
MIRFSLLGLLMLLSGLSQAAVNIAATVPNMGMLAREIGGEHVQVTVMAPPGRDPHYLEARPSMMAALRRADMVVSVGAELETGWLPAAIQGAGNRELVPGKKGYFEGAAHIKRLNEGQQADRSRGDVHPRGNPHFYLDPQRMATVGQALAEHLARLDPDNRDDYLSRATAFRQAVEEQLPQWRSQAAGAPGALLYHGEPDYLMALLDVPVVGYIEPKPGIPPTARHLSTLVGELEGRQGVVLYTDFQPGKGPDFIHRKLGWPTHQLPIQVATEADRDAYFAMIRQWVEAVQP